MRSLKLALGLLVVSSTVALAQSESLRRSQLESICSRNPASPACEELRRELPETTTRTVPGPGTPNRPGEGASGSSEGVSGAGAGGVTPQGNPANSGGSPRSSQ